MQEKDIKKIEYYLDKFKDVDDSDLVGAIKLLTLIKDWNDKKISDDKLVNDMQLRFTEIEICALCDDEVDEEIYEVSEYAYFIGTKIGVSLVKKQADIDFYNSLVADCYTNGYCVERDYKKAFDIYLRLFNKKDYAQALTLAKFYANGYYVKRNLELAERLKKFFYDHNQLNMDYMKLIMEIKKISEDVKKDSID